jgi:hypothetical protein
VETKIEANFGNLIGNIGLVGNEVELGNKPRS